MTCPFARIESASTALVCKSYSRDIAVPPALIADRNDLISERNTVRVELVRAERELEMHKPSTQLRPV
jgi:hypothetical protein